MHSSQHTNHPSSITQQKYSFNTKANEEFRHILHASSKSNASTFGDEPSKFMFMYELGHFPYPSKAWCLSCVQATICSTGIVIISKDQLTKFSTFRYTDHLQIHNIDYIGPPKAKIQEWMQQRSTRVFCWILSWWLNSIIHGMGSWAKKNLVATNRYTNLQMSSLQLKWKSETYEI